MSSKILITASRKDLKQALASVREAFASEARAFIANPRATVLIRMPGCKELCANPAYGRLVKECKMPALPIAKTEEDFEAIYNGDAKGKSRAADDCVCEKMGSIIALRSDHCAFERAYKSLKENPGTIISRLNFLKYHANGKRSYRVFNTYSRLLRAGKSGGRYMLSQLVPDPKLRIELQNRGGATQPRKISFSIRGAGSHDVSKVFTVPQTEAGKTYSDIDKALEEASAMLGKGTSVPKVRDRFCEAIQTAKDKGADYEALGAFVHSLFHDESKEQILERIRHERTRLFDSLVVIDQNMDTIRAANRYVLDAPLRQLASDARAFERNQGKWRTAYRGQFVAVHRGKVIASGRDWDSVTRKVSAQNPGIDPLITHVDGPAFHTATI